MNELTLVTGIAEAGLTRDGQHVFCDFDSPNSKPVSISCTLDTLSRIISHLVDIAKQSKAHYSRPAGSSAMDEFAVEATIICPDSVGIADSAVGPVMVFEVGLCKFAFQIDIHDLNKILAEANRTSLLGRTVI